MQNEKIKISGLTDNCNIKITDIEGNLLLKQSKTNRRYNNFNLEIDGYCFGMVKIYTTTLFHLVLSCYVI